MEYHEDNSIYEGNKLTGLSVSSLKNAPNKGNVLITRRRDKKDSSYLGKTFTKDAFKLGRKKGG